MLERRGRRQPLTLQSLGTIASASLTQLRAGWAGGSGRRERGRGVQSAYARKVTEREGQRLKTTGPIGKPARFGLQRWPRPVYVRRIPPIPKKNS